MATMFKGEIILGKAMSYSQFKKLLKFIEYNHRFGRNGKNIKYVEPTYDMRTRDVFSVTLRGMENMTFTLTNENADKDLFAWIMEYLEGEKWQTVLDFETI